MFPRGLLEMSEPSELTFVMLSAIQGTSVAFPGSCPYGTTGAQWGQQRGVCWVQGWGLSPATSSARSCWGRASP